MAVKLGGIKISLSKKTKTHSVWCIIAILLLAICTAVPAAATEITVTTAEDLASNITEGTYDTIILADNITLTNQLEVMRTVTIRPADDCDTITIDAESNDRIFQVGKSGIPGNLTLSGATGTVLVLTEGEAADGGCLYITDNSTLIIHDGVRITGNYASGKGGGVYCNNGTISMDGGEIVDNEANEVTSDTMYLCPTSNGACTVMLGGNAVVIGSMKLKNTGALYPRLILGDSIGPSSSIILHIDENQWVDRVLVQNGVAQHDRFSLDGLSSDYSIAAYDSDLVLGHSVPNCSLLKTMAEAAGDSLTHLILTGIGPDAYRKQGTDPIAITGKVVIMPNLTDDDTLVTLDAMTTGKLFTIHDGGNLTIYGYSTPGILLTNGSDPSGYGGAIEVQAGATLRMENNVTVAGNTAAYGGGLYVSPAADAILSGISIHSNTATNGAGIAIGGNATDTTGGGNLTLQGSMTMDDDIYLHHTVFPRITNGGYTGSALNITPASPLSAWIDRIVVANSSATELFMLAASIDGYLLSASGTDLVLVAEETEPPAVDPVVPSRTATRTEERTRILTATPTAIPTTAIPTPTVLVPVQTPVQEPTQQSPTPVAGLAAGLVAALLIRSLRR